MDKKPKAPKFINDLTYMCLGSVDSYRFSTATCHCHAQIYRVHQKPTRRSSSVCKSKELLFPYKFTDSDSPCAQCIGMIKELRAQLGLGF